MTIVDNMRVTPRVGGASAFEVVRPNLNQYMDKSADLCRS